LARFRLMVLMFKNHIQHKGAPRAVSFNGEKVKLV
jgi:hypothetical protein